MVKIGIVGAGGIGTVHIDCYKHVNDCKVVAICDPSEIAVKKAQEIGANRYVSIEEMISNESLDAVDICVPTFLHKQLVMEALEYGVNVIVEKPIALNPEDAKEMFAKAKEKGVNLYVAQVLRFTNESKVLRELVETKPYGEVLDACFTRLSACPRWISNGWLFEKQKSGLIPFDLHIHDLDLIVSLFGKPEKVSYTSCGNGDKSYKEHYRINYNFGKFNVSAEAAWFNADNYPFRAVWRVYFERAIVVYDGISVIAYGVGVPPKTFDTEDKIKVSTAINLTNAGMFINELTHFVECLKENKPSDIILPEQVITVVEILSNID